MVACGYAVPVDEESHAGHYAPNTKIPTAPVAKAKRDSFDDGDEVTV